LKRKYQKKGLDVSPPPPAAAPCVPLATVSSTGAGGGVMPSASKTMLIVSSWPGEIENWRSSG
jgi:hypothetical protein